MQWISDKDAEAEEIRLLAEDVRGCRTVSGGVLGILSFEHLSGVANKTRVATNQRNPGRSCPNHNLDDHNTPEVHLKLLEQTGESDCSLAML